MSAPIPFPVEDRRQTIDEALAQGLVARDWPEALRREYQAHSHKTALYSLTFHMKLGIVITYASLAIDAAAAIVRVAVCKTGPPCWPQYRDRRIADDVWRHGDASGQLWRC